MFKKGEWGKRDYMKERGYYELAAYIKA